jgi:DeoR/GlpR family transcriptional regulator of sugar metabolism
MLQSARTAVVVADHAKFGRFAPIRVGNFERVTHLITDRAPDPEIVTALGTLPLEILVADGSDGQ